MELSFGYQSYLSRSRPLSSQRMLNLYAEKAPEQGKTNIFMVGCPGLKEFVDIASEPIWGMESFKDRMWVVSGTTLYSVTEGGVVKTIGGIGTNGANVQFSYNDTQLGILKNSGELYVYSETTGHITKVTDLAFPKASSIAYLNGYTLVSEADSGKIFFTLGDMTSWDALDYFTAEGNPDNAVSIKVDHNDLLVFGTRTTEVFYTTADADAPFQRMSNAFMERGCASPKAIENEDNTVFWIADDGIIYKANGYTPQRVSTHAIEMILQESDDLEDAQSFVYTQEGHKFLVITLPSLTSTTASQTLVYDISTGLWHERQTFSLDRWRANCALNIFNKVYVGGVDIGKIYELDLDFYLDDTDYIKKSATTPNYSNEDNRMIWDKLRIDIEAGQGLTEGQGSDPQVALEYSDDGGFTWSSEVWRSLGKIGDYTRRVIWRRLGSSRQRMFRFTITDPIKVNIMGSFADIRIWK